MASPTPTDAEQSRRARADAIREAVRAHLPDGRGVIAFVGFLEGAPDIRISGGAGLQGSMDKKEFVAMMAELYILAGKMIAEGAKKYGVPSSALSLEIQADAALPRPGVEEYWISRDRRPGAHW